MAVGIIPVCSVPPIGIPVRKLQRDRQPILSKQRRLDADRQHVVLRVTYGQDLDRQPVYFEPAAQESGPQIEGL